jgi:hypothetical protein
MLPEFPEKSITAKEVIKINSKIERLSQENFNETNVARKAITKNLATRKGDT